MTKTQTKNRLARTRGADHEAPTPPPAVPVAKRRRGRPEIELEPEMVRTAAVMARYGATVSEIAKEIGVSERKVYDWYAEHPELLQAVKDGRMLFSQRVIGSLGQRAVGYTYESEKVFSNGFRAVVHEHVPADTAAAINWLVNANVGWRRGDNAAADLLDAAATAKDADGAPVDIRTLALAAIGLLGAAAMGVGSPAPPMLDVTPNASAGPDDDLEDDEDEPMGEETQYDDRDPDFDL